MNVLVTWSTGYVGSAVVGALLAAGHDVHGLARSEESAEALASRGVSVVMGDITDAGGIRAAARAAGAVIHAASTHGTEAAEADRTATGAILEALRGTGKTLIYTSGAWVMGTTPDGITLADEGTLIDPTPMLAWRPAVEQEVLDAASHGIRTLVVRPALVCGGGGGVIGELVGWARERGAGRFVSPPQGEPSWTLVHRDDLGELYALLLVSDLAGGGRGGPRRAVAPRRGAGGARRLRRRPGPRSAALR